MPAASALRAEKVIAERSRGVRVFLHFYLNYDDMKRVLITHHRTFIFHTPFHFFSPLGIEFW